MDKLPKNCIYDKLENVLDVVSGYAFPSKSFSKTEGKKVVKITNVGVKVFVESSDDEKIVLDKEEKYNTFIVGKGDIVVALTRSIINDGLMNEHLQLIILFEPKHLSKIQLSYSFLFI